MGEVIFGYAATFPRLGGTIPAHVGSGKKDQRCCGGATGELTNEPGSATVRQSRLVSYRLLDYLSARFY